MVEETTAMHTALSSCLQKLNERDRRMILTRYERGSGVERAALVSGRSIQACYKALMRIKQVLHDCVLNSVSKEEPA
jgi:RNA polymerase sigma-70 factor (ECF subfamily)